MTYQQASSAPTNQRYYWCQNQILFLICVLQHFSGPQPRNILPRITHVSQGQSAWKQESLPRASLYSRILDLPAILSTWQTAPALARLQLLSYSWFDDFKCFQWQMWITMLYCRRWLVNHTKAFGSAPPGRSSSCPTRLCIRLTKLFLVSIFNKCILHYF